VGAVEQQGVMKMFIRRVCAAAIVGLAMSAGLVGSSYAGSNDWYPKGAYGLDALQGKSFNRSNLRCDQHRDICYDRYGISYHATMRYFGEKDANRAYKTYGKQVFLFSPKRGVICDRRTDSCTNKRWANGNYNNAFNRSTQSRDGNDAYQWRYQQQQQQQEYWRYDD
jgi:hypothetical protein